MITIKLIGGAKKSFNSEQLQIDKSNISVNKLLELLLKMKPDNTSNLDVENILIAINGSDSSAMNGKDTIVSTGDIVSIIPVIHGGLPKKLIFEIEKKQIQIMEIRGQKKVDIQFIDDLRKKFPKIKFQAISSNFILNPSHLKKILYLSINAEKNNILLSNKIETDILMRFGLTLQISNAISSAGMQSSSNFILIAIGNKNYFNSLYSELSDSCVPLFLKNNNLFLKKYFKISKNHIDTVYSKNPLEDILVEKASVLI
ncbi:MAG: MoaD/ThiS family protein [Nitrosopumilus sp.]|jgi:molybdopterin converting factor small subunit/tRNA threonylcarbamoyladenosine modification (KEOPS) complex Cgi121 subunit|nr:MoaD/ThiS family protein [Nitrosopumilus sp.]|tara:strand:- start:835 stop:1608 length:774 start_codon:yes stop_codon:yes gene_type:complete